ncbi:MAG: OmpW/AlkL family protein [Silanimonas lenta]
MRLTPMLAALVAASLAAPAFAEGFSARGGIANVDPKSNNGTIAGARASIDDNTKLLLGASYHFDNGLELAVDFPGSKFSHTVTLEGLGQVVSLKHQPVTVGVNWHFLGSDAGFSPYAGIGYNWTSVSSVRGINALAGAPVDVKNSDGLAAALGADFRLGDSAYLRGEARYIDFDSKVTLGGADIGTANVNPWMLSLSVGFRF